MRIPQILAALAFVAAVVAFRAPLHDVLSGPAGYWLARVVMVGGVLAIGCAVVHGVRLIRA